MYKAPTFKNKKNGYEQHFARLCVPIKCCPSGLEAFLPSHPSSHKISSTKRSLGIYRPKKFSRLKHVKYQQRGRRIVVIVVVVYNLPNSPRSPPSFFFARVLRPRFSFYDTHYPAPFMIIILLSRFFKLVHVFVYRFAYT